MSIMKIGFRGVHDQSAMMAAAASWPDSHLHVIDQPYRFSSWAFDDPENIALWINESGVLVAWAVMQLPFWTVDIVCAPELEAVLCPEILSWVDQRAHAFLNTPPAHPLWFVNIFADQVERIQHLEAAGYLSQASVGPGSWSKVWMQHQSLQQPLHTALPGGFIIRPLRGENEVEAYVDLHCSVFESKNMTTAWRERTLHQQEYIPELDLVAASADGRLVAFCIGWMRAVNGVLCGQVEPLGVSQDFRGLGLGKAILLGMLRQLYAQGAGKVFLETDCSRNAALSLYEAVGFHVIRDVLVYRKDFA